MWPHLTSLNLVGAVLSGSAASELHHLQQLQYLGAMGLHMSPGMRVCMPQLACLDVVSLPAQLPAQLLPLPCAPLPPSALRHPHAL